MKRIYSGVVLLLLCLFAQAQQELHIHHINVGNGDATMIGIYDVASGRYTTKMLIDGGYSSADAMLVPYIQKMCANDNDPTRFKYTVLTHYHNDHYNGLHAFEKGNLTCDTLIDPGGYKIKDYFTGDYPATEKKPKTITEPGDWFDDLAEAVSNGYIKAHSKTFVSFGTTEKSDIGKSFVLGKVGENEVKLTCVAGWGNTLSKEGIAPNPDPDGDSPNNLCLGFLLTCGQFRYLLCGDVGGELEADAGRADYIDQETPLATYLVKKFGTANAWTGTATAKGHVCGFKASHHGSEFSNSPDFLNTMHPTVIITSAGKLDKWHLPSKAFLKRIPSVTTISGGTGTGVMKRGLYFTNLFDFSKADWNSKTTAKSLFANKPGISFDYGNSSATRTYSYLVKVSDTDGISEKSSFEVGRVDIANNDPYKKLAIYHCHK